MLGRREFDDAIYKACERCEDARRRAADCRAMAAHFRARALECGQMTVLGAQAMAALAGDDVPVDVTVAMLIASCQRPSSEYEVEDD